MRIIPDQSGGVFGYAADRNLIRDSGADMDIIAAGSATNDPNADEVCSSVGSCRALGGLAGIKSDGGSSGQTLFIANSYAKGTISIEDTTPSLSYSVGGLIGLNSDTNQGFVGVSSSFSTTTIDIPGCSVTCNENLPRYRGGVIGSQSTLNPSFMDGQVYYDAQAADSTGNSVCIGNSSNEDCNARNTIGSPDPNYFFNNSTNPPLDSWDFASIWQTSLATPVLRTLSQPNPGPVTNLTTSIVSTTEVELTWNQPTHLDENDQESSPSELFVSYKKAGEGTWLNASDMAPPASHFSGNNINGPIRINGLDPGTDYIFALTVKNAGGYYGQPVTAQGRTGTPGLHLVTDCQDFQNINNALDQNYELARNIDCSDTVNWNGGLGFHPIGAFTDGDISAGFTGVFTGNNYTISNLYMGGASDAIMIGVFGATQNAILQDVTFDNPIIHQDQIPFGYGAGLVAYAESTSVKNAHMNNLDLTGPWILAGGLVGAMIGNDPASNVIEKSSVTGSMTSNFDVEGEEGTTMMGGLVSYLFGSSVDNSYANIQYSNPTNNYAYGGIVGLYGFNGSNTPEGQVLKIRNSYGAGGIADAPGLGMVGGIASVSGGPSDTSLSVENSFAHLSVSDSLDIIQKGGVVITSPDSQPVDMTRAYFDADLIGTNQCDGPNTSNTCVPISGDPNYFLNNSTNGPLSEWDFTNIWQTTSTLPVFKTSAIYTITEIPAERLNPQIPTEPPANQPNQSTASGSAEASPKNTSATAVILKNNSGAGGTTNPTAKQNFLERIGEKLKNIVRNLPEGAVRSFPYFLFGLTLIGLLIMLLETKRQTRRLLVLKALINKQRSIAQQRDTFWHIAANYLRAPVTLLMGGAEVLELSKNKPVAYVRISELVKSLQSKVSSIMKKIEESETLKGIEWPKETPLRSTLTSLGFWIPIALVATLIVVANYVTVNFRKFDVSTIGYLTQAMVFVLISYALYLVFNGLRSAKHKTAQAEAMASRQTKALNEARSDLVTETIDVLGGDAASLQSELDKLPSTNDTKALLNEGSSRLRQMIGSFELLAAAETGRLDTLAPGEDHADLNKVLHEALEKEQSTINSKHIVVDTPGINKLEVPGSPRLVSQVVGAVLDNAVAYSPANGTVDVQLLSKPGMHGLSIQDQGPGVSKEQLSHMFEPFTKADGYDALQTDHEGLGIDLYLNKMIMEHLGGKISAASIPGKGTTISVWWPQVR